MSDETPGNGDYTFVRLTNREVYAEVMATKDMVRELVADREDRRKLEARVEKLEGRINGVFVGIGTGVFVGAIALFRGLVGG